MMKVRASFGRRSLAALARPVVEELESRLVLSPLPTPDHVVMVIEENHAYSQIIGASTAPYINSLAQQGALFTQSFAIEHPSQPNYLDIFSGSNQGVTNDNCLTSLKTAANLGSELIAAHDTYAGYSEGLPSVGSTVCTSGSYARKHNPTSDFNNVPTSDNLPFSSFPSDYSRLPTVSIIDPNLVDDMHDGTIQQGDTWLRNNLGNYVTWANTHNSLLIVTWDEDDNSHGNQIATIFVGPMVQPGRYSEHIDHYTVLRTVEDMYGTAHAGMSANRNPISDVWATAQQVDHFAVSVNAGNPDVAGMPFDVTVTAQDASGRTVTGYTGTVTFSSQDPYGASLPSNYTFRPGDQGQATFYGATALYTAGTYDVTVTDTTSGATGSAFVNVQAAPAAGFYVAAPGSASSGAAFDVTVYAVDPYGNIDTNYGGTVTWTTTDTDPGAVLPADYAFQPSDQGVFTYAAAAGNGVTLVTPGDQFITATDTVSGITGNADVLVTSPGPRAGRGKNLGDLARAAADMAAAPSAVSVPVFQERTVSNAQSAAADRFFSLAGGNPEWLPFHRQGHMASGLLADPIDGLDVGALLTDRNSDPLVG